MFSPDALTTRAISPVLGLGREPLLIEVATGRTMLVMDWAGPSLIVSPDFVSHDHPQIFMAACQTLPLIAVINGWPDVVTVAREAGFYVIDPVVSG
jgi:hypothetical protein